MFIRSKTPSYQRPENFEIVLLDHGLYRTFDDTLRTSYANLWLAILSRNENAIKKYSNILGDVPHRLLTSILTARSWDYLQNMKKKRTQQELTHMKRNSNKKIVDIIKLLSKVPRPILLLFKTNDLLRSIDETILEEFDYGDLTCVSATMRHASFAQFQIIPSGSFLSRVLHSIRNWFRFVQYQTLAWLIDVYILIN